MSGYSIYDRDHIYNCPICRPKGTPQYLDKYENYLSIIKSEISSLAISYQSKVRLEQTIDEVLRTIYLSNRPLESYPSVAVVDYRLEEKFLSLETKYNNLLYDYERERSLRLEVESERNQLQERILRLSESQQECVQRHVSHLKVTELHNEIDSLKIQNKELFEEIRVLREKVKGNEELHAHKKELQSEVENKDKRISKILQDVTHYKDLYENFRKEYMKDANSVNHRYERILQEKLQLEESVNDLKERNKRLLRKLETLNHELNFNEGKKYNHRLEETGNFKAAEKPPENEETGEKKFRELERKLNELKEKVEETPVKRAGNDNSYRNSTPTTNPNVSGYDTWKSNKGERRYKHEDNEFVSEEQGGEKRKSSIRMTEAELKKKRRRSSEIVANAGSPQRRNSSPLRSGQRAESRKRTVPESSPCEICLRKHGQDWQGSKF